jgi:uncharacterized protein
MTDDIAGPAYPFRIDPASGGVSWATGGDKLRQNVRIILGTRYGERPMLRDFGSRLHSLVHDPNDSAIADILGTQAQQALLVWEPRIRRRGADAHQLHPDRRSCRQRADRSDPVSER